ncbi:MAG TPA: HAD family phosphatase [Steroidobacteraceae bacterium]|nr:HAD family phosphatase [Steroidobacteraceae bacterium]
MDSDRVILFDLGGVLVEARGRDALQTMLARKLDPDAIMARWLASPAVGRFERGLIPPEAFAEEFIAEWDLALGPDEFLESFAAWVKGFFDGAEALVRTLRGRHRVACLSNINAVHWARLPQLPEMFDAVFASHLTGLMKPDREAFEHALRALAVRPDAVVYFDDLAPNVEAARSLGMRAVQVAALSDIERALRAQGLWA